jgi:rod shape-determining protein MreC
MANISWKVSRARGYAQLPLGIVVVLAIVLVLLGKAQSTLFDRARARVADWMAPALEVVRSPLAQVDRWAGSAGEIFNVYQENMRLKEENARLRQWRNAAIVLEERLRRYQLLLHAVPDPELSSVLAQVIGRSSRPFQQTMIIDAGRASGVKPGQAVIDARGMIGRVFIAGQRTSWVILLTDLNSRVPVTIEPGNIQAIMAGDNSSQPFIEVVSQNAHLKAGDQVASSGDGSLLPPGIPVGTITQHGANFRVSLLADAASSQDVNVLDYKRPIETMPAPQPSDLPAIAAGLKPAAPEPVTAPPPVQPVLQPQTTSTPAVTGSVPPPPPHPTLAQTARPRGVPGSVGASPPATTRSPSTNDDDSNQ